jgi:hypothetical protein
VDAYWIARELDLSECLRKERNDSKNGVKKKTRLRN